MNEIITICKKTETFKVVEAIQKLLGERSLFLFVGEVGSGKTTIISEICQALGFNEVASPSFAIHHRYENRQGQSIDHVDLYRLTDEKDPRTPYFQDPLHLSVGTNQHDLYFAPAGFHSDDE